eukprot:1772633-Prymnesium_polylepis.1
MPATNCTTLKYPHPLRTSRRESDARMVRTALGEVQQRLEEQVSGVCRQMAQRVCSTCCAWKRQ